MVATTMADYGWMCSMGPAGPRLRIVSVARRSGIAGAEVPPYRGPGVRSVMSPKLSGCWLLVDPHWEPAAVEQSGPCPMPSCLTPMYMCLP